MARSRDEGKFVKFFMPDRTEGVYIRRRLNGVENYYDEISLVPYARERRDYGIGLHAQSVYIAESSGSFRRARFLFLKAKVPSSRACARSFARGRGGH